MAKVVKDLLLALLNATLILAAICLFLFWRVTNTTQAVIEDFTASQQIVAPLRADLQGLTAELEDMRATLARLEWDNGAAAPAVLASMTGRLDTLDARMEAAQTRLTRLANLPGEMMDRAIATGVDRVMTRATELRGCVMPSREEG
ncbi:hypothetical protein [Pseudodonghicola xiamenensis]|uniref:Uncharacterized protein n=1 Tax=Pseudodonghicola xiamenensis TaxID=337702 RepID=A0A8J3H7E1_9RHOB|nr:hypothetical protein [Pseudodonghicola xiamenensis]GHG87468.1 hypothetical protein GCM10010961_15930 [Pseudodonghicola xiamenensis]